ncbi:MAG: UDP-3-O-acyl-N-acetylglucosamine deacetylase, partial [Candidatus Omnitrophota bacterium]
DFVDRIRDAGLATQDAPRNYLVIREPVWVEEGYSSIIILPHPHLRISYALKYDNPVIGSNYIDFVINNEFSGNLYEARTFCLE